MRDPDDHSSEPPGGRAAERLRQHLHSRFGDAVTGEERPVPEGGGGPAQPDVGAAEAEEADEPGAPGSTEGEDDAPTRH